MHVVHLGFVAFKPFDVHRDGVDPAGHVLIGIGVHLLIDTVGELQIDKLLSLVLKGGQLLLVLLDEPVELFLPEALPDVLIERLERRLVGPAELVVSIDERPFQDFLRYAFGAAAFLDSAFGVLHALPHDLVVAFAFVPMPSGEGGTAIAAFDYFYRHFLFQKNQQGYLEKKICNKVQVEVFAHLG